MNPKWKEEFAKLTPDQQRAYLASQYGEQMAKMSPEQKEQYATQVWGAKPIQQPTPTVDANGRPLLTSYGAATREGLRNVGAGIKEGFMGAVALPYIGYEALTNPKKTMEGVIGAGGTAVEGALHAGEVPGAISDLYHYIMGKPGGPEEAIRTAGEVSGHLGGQAAAIAATMGAGEAVASSRMGQAIKEVTGDIPGVRKWSAVRDILMGREPTPEIGATEPIVVKPGFTARDVRVGATQKIPVTPGSEAQAAAEEAETAKAPKLVPEPRIKITDKPGTYYSETKADLPKAIMRGEEGAFEVGRARGLTEPGTLIRPKEAEITTEGPRERIDISQLKNPLTERRVTTGVSPTGEERRLVQSPEALQEEVMRPGMHSIGPFVDTEGASATMGRDVNMPKMGPEMQQALDNAIKAEGGRTWSQATAKPISDTLKSSGVDHEIVGSVGEGRTSSNDLDIVINGGHENVADALSQHGFEHSHNTGHGSVFVNNETGQNIDLWHDEPLQGK